MMSQTPTKIHTKKIYYPPFSQHWVIHFFVFTSLIALFILFSGSALMQRFERMALDSFFRHRPAIAQDSRIIYIEIAEDSLQAIRHFPWPRRYYAVISHVLKEWKAKAVLFDLIFVEPSDAHDDAAMTEAIEKSGNIYLPVFLERKGKEKKWVHSLPEFEKNAKALGHANIVPDPDAIIRRIEPFRESEGIKYPHIGLQMAYDILDKELTPSDNDLPIGEDGKILVNWAGKWTETFRHFSFVDVLRSYNAINIGKTDTVVKPPDIEDKICLIGFTMSGHTDVKATPLEQSYPGIGTIANVINSVLTKQYVKPMPKEVNLAVLVVLGLISSFSCLPFRNWLSPLVIITLSISWVVFSFMMFARSGIWFITVQPILLMFTIMFFSMLYGKIIGDRQTQHFFLLSMRDSLTGLYVMRYFRGRLKEFIEVAKEQHQPLCLILIDIDNFKKINDTYGHQAGDMILKGTAQHIQSQIRYKRTAEEADIAARYGGEEFVIVLPETDMAHAVYNVAERIRESIAKSPYRWGNDVINVTISLGVSRLGPEDDAESLVRRADEALYEAKNTGKNRTCHQKLLDSEPI